MISLDFLAQHPSYNEELAKWMFQEWGDYYPEATLEKTRRWVKRTSRNSGLPITMIASHDKILAGFAMVQRQELIREEGLTPWLGGLLVKEDYRRQGVGKRLLEWVVTYSKSLGYQKMYLLAFDEGHCGWYKNHGWVVLRTDIVNDHPLFIMSTKL